VHFSRLPNNTPFKRGVDEMSENTAFSSFSIVRTPQKLSRARNPILIKKNVDRSGNFGRIISVGASDCFGLVRWCNQFSSGHQI
jgi:hypothetical protein